MVFVDQEAEVLVSDDPAHLDLPEGDKRPEQGNARVLGREGSLGSGASPELTIEAELPALAAFADQPAARHLQGLGAVWRRHATLDRAVALAEASSATLAPAAPEGLVELFLENHFDRLSNPSPQQALDVVPKRDDAAVDRGSFLHRLASFRPVGEVGC